MRVDRPSIIYWNNIPTPYVVGRFNSVATRGNLHFEAWFSECREPDRSWAVVESDWAFPARYICPKVVGGRTLHLPVAELNLTRPDLLVCLYGSPSFALGALAARASGARVAFRALPTFETWVPRSRRRELSKRFLFRAVDGAKVPGPEGAAYAQRYGLPPDRLFSVTQTVDVEHYARAMTLRADERERRREELGLTGTVFLYVGRLWKKKGLDDLFAAYSAARESHADMSLLVIGDGVDQERYRTQFMNLPGVHFVDFVQPADLPFWYALADVLVLPTLGDPHGLVVEEAMAAGLPVICTEAAGDIRRRLPDGEAGFIVPPNCPSKLAERMLHLARDEELRRRFGRFGHQIVLDRNHDHYARDFEAFVESVLSMPKRRTPERWIAQSLGVAVNAALASTAPAPLIAPGSHHWQRIGWRG
ncbi:MAG: hypothetical protein QOJ59_1038 [Thermomicrobiales bacterium]|nr:hypothetical protein [Thermomicrobiales bacterium]